MAVTKDLGAVTAYAHAVEGGYTGTLAEFETLMASYATVAQQAAASASDAEAFGAGTRSGVPVSSGDDAYENNAVYYAGIAEDAKDDAEAAAASLVIEDEFDEDSTNALENGVITKALETKAEIDGAYESMTVGNAEQLVSTVFVNDEEPYNFRTSGGSADIGDRLYDTIVGGTVNWNQLAKDFNVSGNNWYADQGFSFSNGILTATVRGLYGATQLNNGFNLIAGHKYLFNADIKADTSSIVINLNTLSYTPLYLFRNTNGAFEKSSKLFSAQSTFVTYLKIQDNRSSGWTEFSVKNLQVIDLTQMFGTTIADYIYSLEQANAGAGVAWFKKLFPKPYYAYNAGELMSVNAVSHDMVGFNAFDNTTGKAKLVGGQQYQITGAYTALSYSTGETITPDSNGKFTPTESGELTVTGGNGTTTCVHLVWDGERDGEYEEYVKHSYPLDSSLTLRGIPKLDASNNLYYDGDTYESDGTVTRKYGIVDLGTLTWTYYSSETAFYCEVTGINRNNGYAICEGYTRNWTSVSNINNLEFTGASGADGILWFKNTAYTDAESFKASVSGKYLVYKLKTTATESVDPFQSPQIVDDFGTEEYVDYALSEGDRDVAIPVGHITKYTNNLRAKLEMSPNSPDGAGDYLVRQTNGINEYVSLSSNATIQNIIARLEALEGGGE